MSVIVSMVMLMRVTVIRSMFMVVGMLVHRFVFYFHIFSRAASPLPPLLDG